MCFWFWAGEGARHDVGEPVAQAAGRGINSGMGRVYGDTFKSQAQEGLLLSVCKDKGFEALEYDGICDSGVSMIPGRAEKWIT